VRGGGGAKGKGVNARERRGGHERRQWGGGGGGGVGGGGNGTECVRMEKTTEGIGEKEERSLKTRKRGHSKWVGGGWYWERKKLVGKRKRVMSRRFHSRTKKVVGGGKEQGVGLVN